MHKLYMTAKIAWVNITRECDNTGKKLPEPKRSTLAGKVAIEIWTDKVGLAQIELPIFNGREGLAVGEPSKGAALGDSIIEAAKELALRAWSDKREAKVEL